MTSDEFIAWAIDEPKRPRCELAAGELVLMAPERAAHARVKATIWRVLDDALKAARLPCEAYPDGMAVKVDDSVTYQPDALVRCGDPLPDDAVKITDPVIVVEVISPLSLARDTGPSWRTTSGCPRSGTT
jgi:Uma2 family endonuclease